MEEIDVTTVFSVFDDLRDVDNAIAKARQNWDICCDQMSDYVRIGDLSTANRLGDIITSIVYCIEDYHVYKRRLESSYEYLWAQSQDSDDDI